MIKHIAFTLYPVKDVARARRFYEEILKLQVTHNFKNSWIEYHLDNGCFAISDMTPVAPSARAGGSIAFEVDDLDAMVKSLREQNVVVKVEPFATPVCRMAVVLDPEGNALTLHAKKTNAEHPQD